ncbi:hypothetical protein [Tsukamurella pulmonis]|nr:hypothetical protein [Tsukamurella pulmonis]
MTESTPKPVTVVVAGFAASCAGDAGLLGQVLCLAADRFRLLG